MSSFSQNHTDQSLRDFQQKFSDALYQPKGPAPIDYVVDNEKMHEQFRVYQNNVWYSLSSALMGVLPTAVQLVGEKFFRALCVAYAKQTLPEVGTLIGYGRGLPDFIRHYEPANNIPYLADVVALEYARHHAYHASDQPSLDPVSLSQVDPERMGDIRFELSESATLLQSDFDIHQIWQAHQVAADTGEAISSHIDISRGNELIVFRKAYDINVMPLSSEVFSALKSIKANECLGELIENIVERFPDANPQALLTTLITMGCLVRFTLD